MSDGRTYWWAKDSAWWRRERIVELGEEFGPAGPAVIDWLCCEAKAQNDGGRVKSGERSVARGCFVDRVTVGHVLSRSVTLGLLDEFEGREGLFVCRISGWKSDQERGQAATRKARQRATAPAENGAVEPNVSDDSPGQTVTHRDKSRSVTECPLTGEDRREEKQQEEDARPSTPIAGLHEHLDDVLTVLRDAPDLEIEPLAVNAALMARPDGDALAAARAVASWAHEGGLRVRGANRLLLSAFRQQSEETARASGVRDAAADRESRRGTTTGTGRLARRGRASAADILQAGADLEAELSR